MPARRPSKVRTEKSVASQESLSVHWCSAKIVTGMNAIKVYIFVSI